MNVWMSDQYYPGTLTNFPTQSKIQPSVGEAFGRGPLVVIYPEEICYINVKPEDTAEIVQSVKKRRGIECLHRVKFAL
jgi:hypothetical protein